MVSQVYRLHPPAESLTTNLHAAGRQQTWISRIHFQSLSPGCPWCRRNSLIPGFFKSTVSKTDTARLDSSNASLTHPSPSRAPTIKSGTTGGLRTILTVEGSSSIARSPSLAFETLPENGDVKHTSSSIEFVFLAINGVAKRWWIYIFVH